MQAVSPDALWFCHMVFFFFFFLKSEPNLKELGFALSTCNVEEGGIGSWQQLGIWV